MKKLILIFGLLFLLSFSSEIFPQNLNNWELRENKKNNYDNATWEKLFPYTTIGQDEEGVDICETSDGNIIMVGNIIDIYYHHHVKIIKANVFGDTIWTKAFKLDDTLESSATGCIDTENGNFVVTGYYEKSYGHAIYLLKFDASGTIIWEKKYSELSTLYYDNYDIQRTPDNGFFIYGGDFILKTDSLGNEQWNNNFNTIIADISKPFGNHYYVLGYDTYYNKYFFKIDINGNLIWQKQLPAFSDYALIKTQELSNNLVLFGYTRYYTQPPDYFITTFFLIKSDTSGNIYKIDSIPTYHQEEISIRCFEVINDNRFVFSSSTHFGLPPHQCIMRIIDSNANILKRQIITSEQYAGYKIIESIYLSLQSGHILYGGIGCWNMVGTDNTSRFYGIRTDSNLLISAVGITEPETEIPDSYKLFQNYPNPFNSGTIIGFSVPKTSQIKIVIYDILGREVKVLCNSIFNAGKYNIRLDMTEFVSGIYFYSMYNEGNLISTKKLILIK